jgi:hypothetical protein
VTALPCILSSWSVLPAAFVRGGAHIDWRGSPQNSGRDCVARLNGAFSNDCPWRAVARSKKAISMWVYLPDLEYRQPPDLPPGMVKLNSSRANVQPLRSKKGQASICGWSARIMIGLATCRFSQGPSRPNSPDRSHEAHRRLYSEGIADPTVGG